jgi:hypothetical protein
MNADMTEVSLLRKDCPQIEVTDIAQMLREHFSGETACLRERTDKAELFVCEDASFSEMADANWWEGCYSCIFFSNDAALRLVKAPCDPVAAGRLLRECAEGQESAWRRESTYALRGEIKGDHALLSVGGKTRIAFREYFTPDARGWLRLYDSRLAGLL